jgi:hypothetical protein
MRTSFLSKLKNADGIAHSFHDKNYNNRNTVIPYQIGIQQPCAYTPVECSWLNLISVERNLGI